MDFNENEILHSENKDNTSNSLYCEKNFCRCGEKCCCGSVQDKGCYVCCNCGQKVYLDDGDTLMPCPRCTNKTFTKE